MKTLRLLIFGFLATVAVGRAQITNSGSYNVQSLTWSGPTVMDSSTLQGAQQSYNENAEFQYVNPPQAIAEVVTPQIQALANGLQDNPLQMLNYVHDHIRYVFYFGSKKGAELTLLEKSGNDFDQCALLMAMLEAAGYTNAQYQFGWMVMPYDNASAPGYDLHHWLQLSLNNTNWLTTSNYLANLVYYRGYPTYAAFWGNNLFSFQREWITLTINSTNYYLDPAFKVSEPVTGINLASAMGFSSNTLASVAGGTDTGTYVSGLNEGAIRSNLTGCTSNLLSYLQTSYPNATPQQILGGWQIQPSTYTTLPTTLPFLVTNLGGVLPVLNWSYEPTNMMSSLTITFANTNYHWFMPQFEGQRLSLVFGNTGLAQLWQDDTLLAQGTNSGTSGTTNVVLFAHHPVGNWNPTNNSFIDTGAYDQTTSMPYQRTNATYTLLYAFEPDWGWLQQRQNMLDNYLQEGFTNGSRQVVSETLNVMGLNWMLQTEGSQQLLCQQLSILPMNYHRLGRMAQEGGKGYYVDAYMEEDSDMEGTGFDENSVLNYAREQTLKNYFGSALEGGIIEQLQATNLPAASTVKMMEVANTNGQAIYMAYYGNWSTVESALVNYSTATLDGIYTNYILQDYFVMLPQNGSNHIAGANSWAGYGYMGYGNSIAMIISGAYGGYSAFPVTVDPPDVQESGDNQPTTFTAVSATTANPTTADPVDTADGTFQVENTDLSLGQGEPRGITLSRYYNGTRRYSNPAAMAGGWINNYCITANSYAAPQASLGGTTPAQMAPMLVASCATIQFYDALAADPGNWLTTMLISKWGSDQITAGGVSVNLGKDTLQFVKQPNGTFTPPAGSTATLTQTNSVYSLLMRHGNQFNFNTNGLLASIVDPYGQTLSVGHNSSNWVSTVTDWKNRTLTFTYSGTPSRLTSISDGTRTASYGYSTAYNPQGDLTSFTDAEGKTCTYVYDTNHQITATWNASSPSQLVVSNVYDTQGHITTQYTEGQASKMWQIFWSGWETVEYDPSNDVSAYLYDGQSRLTTIINPLGDESETVYDGQNHVIDTVSPLLEINQFVYDGNNNLIQTIDPLNHTNQFFYNSQNNLIRAVDPNTHAITFGYNTQFSLTGQTNGAGDWVNYAYNGNGTMATRTDVGGATQYGYDSFGQLETITYPNNLGGVTNINSYLGDVTNRMDGRGFATGFQYNNRRQLTNTIAPTNLTVTASFDANGNVASITDARGSVTSKAWSPTRHLLATTLPTTPQGTPVLTNGYDGRDWLATSADALGNPTLYVNNLAGWLNSVTDPLLRTARFTYDNDGRKLTSANAGNETNNQTWDARGKLIQLIDGAGHVSTRTYDAAGNQIVMTNRNNNPWKFYFDAANRLTNTVTPLGRHTIVTFNHQGLAASITDPSNQLTSFYYDAKGRLTNRTDNLASTFYGYDANNNPTIIAENTRTNVWTYDAYNRVSSYQDISGNLIQYHYDANGNLTNLVYPGGRNVYYAYDTLNRMTSVTDWSGRKSSIGYDLDSRITSIIRPNGSSRTIAYDAAGQTTNIMEQMGNSLPIAIFKYAWTNTGSMAWEFAAPLPHTNAPPARTMTYDADNRLSTFLGPTMGSAQNVGVDLDGNTISAPLTNDTFVSYAYDPRNRLQNAGGVTNTYDAMNNRIAQQYGTNSLSYVINPNAKLPQVLMRIKNGVTNYYIYGPGLLYQITEAVTGTNTLTYHYDYRGSTIALSADNGLVTDRMEYSLYGSATYRVGTNDTPFWFNGYFGVQTDPNGLLYMRARYYNPYLCRFINPDPSGFSGGLNFYAYANGNPVSLIDPFGLSFWSATGNFLEGAVIGAGITVIVVIAAPEIVAGGAIALGWAGVEAATATTASTAIVTGGLGVTAVVGGGATLYNAGQNAVAGNWDNVAYDAGSLTGGALVGGFGGGRYIADNVSPEPSTVPPSWNPFTADYVSTPTAPNGYGFQRNADLPLATDIYNWLGTGPTPSSGGGSATGIATGVGLFAQPSLNSSPTPSSSSSSTGK